MRRQELEGVSIVCEACETSKTEIVMGVQLNDFYESAVYMCQSCGPIDLNLMQFCRESVIGCNDN